VKKGTLYFDYFTYQKMEPDLIQDSLKKENFEDYDFGPNFKRLVVNDNVRELQTVLRDKLVFFLVFIIMHLYFTLLD
jgi:hypothetical protein